MNVTRVVIAAVAMLAAAGPAWAQEPARDAGTPHVLSATRQGLEERAARLDRMARADSLSADERADTARAAAAIRARLADGDFKVGERIVLSVEGEKELTDTFTVAPGRILTLPTIGDVPLQGVLRSELQPYLTRRIGQNLRNPLVRARPFVRLSIQGSVAKPGFYGVPAEALLSDPLMVAGGTLPEANMKKLRIERDGKPIWEGAALQQAIAEGRTLDEAGLIAGDQFVVPGKRRGGASETLSFAALVLGLPLTIYSLIKITH